MNKVEKFIVPTDSYKDKKYVAIMVDGRRIAFGNRHYQHFKDSVPKELGGGKWSKLDHGDLKRRKAYRLRHAGVLTTNGKRAIDIKYSPAWFSYYYLW